MTSAALAVRRVKRCARTLAAVSRGGTRTVSVMRPVCLKVFTLCVAGAILSSCAGVSAALAPEAASSTPPSAQWVEQSFHGAGLVLTLDHPVAWRSQLQPLSLHYSATFGFLANFPLHQFCSHPSPLSFQCTGADAGTLPAGGVVAMFGTEGYGPGPGIADALLSQGTATTVDGHRASERSGNGSECLGVGANHDLTFWIDDGRSQGVFDITFCWLGSALLSDDVHAVANRLTLRPDPTNAGPSPS
jgi:hypothetical protein